MTNSFPTDLPRFRGSNEMLERTLQSIPIGSQTYSKSYMVLPKGVSPLFVNEAKGCRFWDVDGNEFIDLSNSLASVTLGYCDPLVDHAVRSQLEKGVTFSLSHSLELQVAELIIDMIPSAEMVQFAKNGTDVTSAAIRLARHITNRDHIALCGYHGWQDWSICTTTKDSGIPNAAKGLSHSFPYNDLLALEQLFHSYKDQFAAVIMEPMTDQWPDKGFLKDVKNLANRNGALLIFDETVTGFRFSNGGAQELFNVVPDLTTLGKGIANGYPLSALTGRREYMRSIDQIFFSTTFGGETLSLAAAKVVLSRLKDEPILEKLSMEGKWLSDTVEESINTHGLYDTIHLVGHPSWKLWRISDHPNSPALDIRAFMLQELLANGIFTLGSHNMSASHRRVDLQRIANEYSVILEQLALALEQSGTLKSLLRCEPPSPVFKVRR